MWERGEHGSLHLVPQVELFEFKGEDLTEEEDGGIIRRIRTRGEGYAKPNEGALVEGEAHNLGFSLGLRCAGPGWLWAGPYLSVIQLSYL